MTLHKNSTLGRKILVYSLYPLLLFIPIFIAIYMVQQGVNHAVIISSISIGMALLIFSLEYIYPEHQEWHPTKKVMTHDFLHMAITSVVPTKLFEFLIHLLLPIIAIWGAGQIDGFTTWYDAGNVGYFSLFIQMLIAVHLGDMGYYVLHRALHEIPQIWPFHAVHHSPDQLYVVASNRAHPLQIFFTYGMQIAILYAMGITSEALLMFSVFVSVNGQLQHCNIHMRSGIFNWIFATPDLHRWHHSIEIAESNSNYGNNVVLWDILFATRYLPKQVGIEAEHIGLPPGTDFPETFMGHVKAPFRWEKIRYDRDEKE